MPYPLAVDDIGELHAYNDHGRALCGLAGVVMPAAAPRPHPGGGGHRLEPFVPDSPASCRGCSDRIPPVHR